MANLKTLTRHIKSFPHHRAPENILRVSIPPSSTKDPGRIIKLSLTANSLIDAIKDMQNGPHLIVTLVGIGWSEGTAEKVFTTGRTVTSWEVILIRKSCLFHLVS